MSEYNNSGTNLVEVYGFVGWITTIVAYIVYILWAFIPNKTLESLGITYYPDKHWAITIPLILSMTIVYIIIGYELWNMTLIKDKRDICNIEDHTTEHWTEEEVMEGWRSDGKTVPPLKDIHPYIIEKIINSYNSNKLKECNLN